MVEFITILSSTLGAATTVTKFVAQLSGVKDETGTVVYQVERVNEDIIEARRLRYIKELHLTEREFSRIDRIIKDTENAVLKIARQVESSRVGVAINGTVKLYDRFDWVLRGSSAVTGNQQNLQTCHQSLLGEISYLRQKEAAVALVSPLHMPPPYEETARDGSDARTQWKKSPKLSPITYDYSGNDETNSPTDLLDVFDNPMQLSSLRPTTSTNNVPRTETPTPAKIHPERALFEDMQQLAKWK